MPHVFLDFLNFECFVSANSFTPWDSSVGRLSTTLASENYFESGIELMQVINLNYLCFYIIYVTLCFTIITLMQLFSQRFSLFFPLVFISVCCSQRSQQIIPENQVAFMKRWLPTTEVLATNPFQFK